MNKFVACNIPRYQTFKNIMLMFDGRENSVGQL
jgi:hypothetical protein